MLYWAEPCPACIGLSRALRGSHLVGLARRPHHERASRPGLDRGRDLGLRHGWGPPRRGNRHRHAEPTEVLLGIGPRPRGGSGLGRVAPDDRRRATAAATQVGHEVVEA